MAWPLIQFVSEPSSSATLRYDFNAKDASSYCHPLGADDLDLGTPAFTGEPEGVGADYGYRKMRFVQRIEGTKAVAFAKQSALARQLLRSTNWLKFQWNASVSPVYFKTYRGEPGALSVEHGDTANAWDIIVPLTTEPFAYGARVTISSVAMGSSLSHARPMRYVLPALKGDAPTGLRVSVEMLGQAADAVRVVVVSSDSSVSDPVYDIGTGDGHTAGSGTDAGVTNANYLGGFYRTVTIGTGANLLGRLSGTIASPPPRGRYKVLLRCEADPISGSVANRYTFSFGVITNDEFYLPTVALDTPGAGSVFRGWVDLGEISFPRGLSLPDDVTSTMSSLPWNLKIGTAAQNAGVVRLDALKLVPIYGPNIRNATVLRTAPQNTTRVMLGTGETGWWDGDTESFWRNDSAVVDIQMAPQLQRGGFPVADPAATENVLMVFPEGAVSQEAGTWNATVSYYPRWLHIGDGA